MFISTRDQSVQCSFQEAFRQGRAPEGGLWLPETLPDLSLKQLKDMGEDSFPDLAARLLPHLWTELSAAEAKEICQESFSEEAFGGEGMNARALNPYNNRELVLFTDRGPSGARQDYAAALTAALRRRWGGEEAVLFISAPAASSIRGLAAMPATLPADRRLYLADERFADSDILSLEKGLCTEAALGLRLIPETGRGERLWNRLLESAELREAAAAAGYRLMPLDGSSVQELITGVLLLLAAIAKLASRELLPENEPLDLALPSSALDLALAALYVKSMGLPLGHILICDSRNKLFSDFLRNGRYSLDRQTVRTLFGSDDLLFPPVLEALLFELSGRSRSLLKSWRDEAERDNAFTVPRAVQQSWRAHLSASFNDDRSIQKEAQRLYTETDHLLDPAAAAAFSAWRRQTSRGHNGSALFLCGDHPLWNEAYCSYVLFDAKQARRVAENLPAEIALESGLQEPKLLALGRQQAPDDERLFCDVTETSAVDAVKQLLR